MSDSLALQASSVTDEQITKPAARPGFGSMLKAVLESLVAAQTRQFENTQPLLYRFPPL
jgi:hypothetical protein